MGHAFIAWIPLAALAAIGLSTGSLALALSRQHGVKAIVLSSGDDAHAFLANVFKVSILAATCFCIAYAVKPTSVETLGPIRWLALPALSNAGLAAMLAGTLIVFAAQLNMGRSWRVGIDHNHRTALVTAGLYRFSRNPIYLGMMCVIAGVFLVAPNALTFAMLGVAAVAISAQIRLEEEFLLRLHGQAYTAYRTRTRRWV